MTKRNPIAKSLRSPEYQQKIVPDKRESEFTEAALEDLLFEMEASRRARELGLSMEIVTPPVETAIKAFLN